MRIDWDEGKNRSLEKERGISFERVACIIEQDKALDLFQNPNPKFKNQSMYIVEIDSYAYVVPFVKDSEGIFLKTIYPSRAMTKKYLKKEEPCDDE